MYTTPINDLKLARNERKLRLRECRIEWQAMALVSILAFVGIIQGITALAIA